MHEDNPNQVNWCFTTFCWNDNFQQDSPNSFPLFILIFPPPSPTKINIPDESSLCSVQKKQHVDVFIWTIGETSRVPSSPNINVLFLVGINALIKYVMNIVSIREPQMRWWWLWIPLHHIHEDKENKNQYTVEVICAGVLSLLFIVSQHPPPRFLPLRNRFPPHSL